MTGVGKRRRACRPEASGILHGYSRQSGTTVLLSAGGPVSILIHRSPLDFLGISP